MTNMQQLKARLAELLDQKDELDLRGASEKRTESHKEEVRRLREEIADARAEIRDFAE
jgi:chromosome segregation ATPase